MPPATVVMCRAGTREEGEQEPVGPVPMTRADVPAGLERSRSVDRAGGRPGEHGGVGVETGGGEDLRPRGQEILGENRPAGACRARRTADNRGAARPAVVAVAARAIGADDDLVTDADRRRRPDRVDDPDRLVTGRQGTGS